MSCMIEKSLHGLLRRWRRVGRSRVHGPALGVVRENEVNSSLVVVQSVGWQLGHALYVIRNPISRSLLLWEISDLSWWSHRGAVGSTSVAARYTAT